MKKAFKIFGIVVASILALAIIAVGTVAFIWRNEIGTVLSIEKIAKENMGQGDGCFYCIKYKGGYYFDDYLEEGGAASDSELINFIVKKITKGISIPGFTFSACSSFTCETEEGDRLFCRNFDFTKSNGAILFSDPGKGRYASVSTVDLKYCGVSRVSSDLSIVDKIKCLALPYAPLDGMNEMGLACSIYVSNQGVQTDINTDKPDITSTTMLRLVLDYASTVDEAIELIKQYDMHDSSTSSYHYSISDATGKAACLEWVSGTSETDTDGTKRELKITYSEGSSPFVVTNFILAEGYYSDDSEKHGLDRYTDITEALAETDNVVANENAAMDILELAGVRTRISAGKQSYSSSVTLWSVVYNLTDKTVTLVANEHYGEPEYTFTYTFSDFSD